MTLPKGLSDDERRAAQRIRSARWRAAHPGANAEAVRRSDKKHYAKRRARKFMQKFGVPIEHRDAVLASQGFKCAVCGTTTPNTTKGWQQDHCHKTNQVRGVLCQRCNTDLAVVEDVEHCNRLRAYLERYQCPSLKICS